MIFIERLVYIFILFVVCDYIYIYIYIYICWMSGGRPVSWFLTIDSMVRHVNVNISAGTASMALLSRLMVRSSSSCSRRLIWRDSSGARMTCSDVLDSARTRRTRSLDSVVSRMSFGRKVASSRSVRTSDLRVGARCMACRYLRRPRMPSSLCMYVCVYVCVFVCVYVAMCVYIRIFICVCMCVT